MALECPWCHWTSELYKMEFVVLLKKTTSDYRMVNGNSEVIAADLQNPYRMEPPASLRCGQISTNIYNISSIEWNFSNIENLWIQISIKWWGPGPPFPSRNSNGDYIIHFLWIVLVEENSMFSHLWKRLAKATSEWRAILQWSSLRFKGKEGRSSRERK